MNACGTAAARARARVTVEGACAPLIPRGSTGYQDSPTLAFIEYEVLEAQDARRK